MGMNDPSWIGGSRVLIIARFSGLPRVASTTDAAGPRARNLPIFHRQLLKELLVNAAITFGVITSIFLIAGSLSVLHKSEMITLTVFLRGVYFFVGVNLDKILPMTILVATVVTFGRWAADNELNAIRHCGISLYNLFAPGLLFGLLGSALVLYVNDKVAPTMELNRKEMVEKSVNETIEAALERGLDYIAVSDSIRMYFESPDPETRKFRNIRLKMYSDGEDDEALVVKAEIAAKSGFLEVDTKKGCLVLTLNDVESKAGSSEGVRIGSIERFEFPLPDEAIEKKPRHQTLAELIAAQSRKYKGDPKTRELTGEFHRRVSGSFACVLFTLLAMPLAVIFRHGNRMVAFLIAFLIAIVVYYPTFILGGLLAKETDLNPLFAMWSGSVILLVLGSSLLTVVLRR
jgi:lipopolysaccharide export LptBFGC system permease protein LptF